MTLALSAQYTPYEPFNCCAHFVRAFRNHHGLEQRIPWDKVGLLGRRISPAPAIAVAEWSQISPGRPYMTAYRCPLGEIWHTTPCRIGVGDLTLQSNIADFASSTSARGRRCVHILGTRAHATSEEEKPCPWSYLARWRFARPLPRTLPSRIGSMCEVFSDDGWSIMLHLSLQRPRFGR